MALSKCNECGHQVSTKAEVCPGCGTKIKRSGGVGGWVVLLLGVGFVVWVSSLYNASDDQGLTNPEPVSYAKTVKPVKAEDPPIEVKEPGAQWSYDKQEDSMTGQVNRSASVSSSNQLSLTWPYAGLQRGVLTFRNHPRFGKDAIVQIEQGQILCRSYEDCLVLVRFDDAEPMSFRAIGPADGGTTMFFFRDYGGFTSRALKSSRLRVSFDVYKNGAQMLEFDVSGFSQEKFMQ